MPLTPTLVDVRGADATVRPALLLARRAGRCFVQVNHAAGDNRLQWVDAGAVTSASPVLRASFRTGESEAVALSRPRLQR